MNRKIEMRYVRSTVYRMLNTLYSLELMDWDAWDATWDAWGAAAEDAARDAWGARLPQGTKGG